MKKNSQNFSMEDVRQLASSREGQQLLSLLRQAGGEDLQRAAASGDVGAIKAALGPLMRSPQFQALMKELEGRHG